jgi:hypothetical protein
MVEPLLFFSKTEGLISSVALPCCVAKVVDTESCWPTAMLTESKKVRKSRFLSMHNSIETMSNEY